jgi:hypothetical protein
MHAKKITLFWCMENTIWFFSFEILGCMHKKHFFFKFVFVLFKSWWKPCILIPDFYFYDVKYIPILSKIILPILVKDLKGRNYYYLPMRKSSSHSIGSTKVKAILVNIKTDQHILKYLIE